MKKFEIHSEGLYEASNKSSPSRKRTPDCDNSWGKGREESNNNTSGLEHPLTKKARLTSEIGQSSNKTVESTKNSQVNTYGLPGLISLFLRKTSEDEQNISRCSHLEELQKQFKGADNSLKDCYYKLRPFLETYDSCQGVCERTPIEELLQYQQQIEEKLQRIPVLASNDQYSKIDFKVFADENLIKMQQIIESMNTIDSTGTSGILLQRKIEEHRTNLLPILRDDKNGTLEKVRENLKGLSDRINNLIIKECTNQLQVAEQFPETIDDGQRSKEEISQIKEAQHFQNFQNASNELNGSLKRAVEILSKSESERPSQETVEQEQVLNDLKTCFRKFSTQFNNTKIIIELEDTVKCLNDSESAITDEDIFGIVKKFRPPEHLTAFYQQHAKKHWRAIAIKRAKEDTKREIAPEELEKYIEDYLEKLDQKPRELLENTEIWTRCKPEIFAKILEDGRIKSAFETGTYPNKLYCERRGDVNEALFGYPRDLPPQLHPSYGYATDDPDGKHYGVDRLYGTVAIRLRSNVKKRATVTIDDSYGHSDGKNFLYMRATPYNDPSKEAFSLMKIDRKVNLHMESDRDPLDFKSIKEDVIMSGNTYVEVQIHPGNVMLKDIAEIVFHRSLNDNPTLREKLIAELKKHNIPYRFKISDIGTKEEMTFKAAVAQGDSFTKVRDGSGRVIFAEYDYEHYQKCKEEINKALNQKSASKELITIMKKVPFFRKIYKMGIGVWEKYTLEQHTLMVLDQFSRYQAKNWDSPLLTKEEFGLMLAVHDIGKPQAFQMTGETSKQHEYNTRLVPMILKWLDIPDKNVN